jgi:hypothetical protein
MILVLITGGEREGTRALIVTNTVGRASLIQVARSCRVFLNLVCGDNIVYKKEKLFEYPMRVIVPTCSNDEKLGRGGMHLWYR